MDFFKHFRKKKVVDDSELRGMPEGFTVSKKSDKVPPYLNGKILWNSAIGELLNKIRIWQVVSLLLLLVVLTTVSGLIYIGSQSKFIPYIVQVNERGSVTTVGPAYAAPSVEERIIKTTVVDFVHNLRTVTPDIDLQKKSILRVYGFLTVGDPAMVRINEWYLDDPFSKALKSTINVEITSALPLSSDGSWQVDWVEKIYDRSGKLLSTSPYRAIINTYILKTAQERTEEDMRLNPLSIYVREISWSRQ